MVPRNTRSTYVPGTYLVRSRLLYVWISKYQSVLFVLSRYHTYWCWYRIVLTLLELQSRFGDESLGIWVVCPHNGTAVLKRWIVLWHFHRIVVLLRRTGCASNVYQQCSPAMCTSGTYDVYTIPEIQYVNPTADMTLQNHFHLGSRNLLCWVFFLRFCGVLKSFVG